MSQSQSRFGFLRNRYVRILTIVLILQAALFYNISHGENVPLHRPLSEFPVSVGDWQIGQEGVMEKEVLDVLKADDTVTRIYVNPGKGRMAGLFVAYFNSQRTGRTPHSPRNCLGGAGWVPSFTDVISFPVPGEAEPITVNRYLVGKGEEKSVILYWYQTPKRVIASEYAAKVYLVTDAIRYNRTDTAFVRIIVPVVADDVDAATATATEFARSVFGPLRNYLPS